jgi:hypothetical protein
VVGAILVTSIVAVAAILLGREKESTDIELLMELRDNPEVTSFLASGFFPESVKQRFLKAIVDGGLHAQRLHEATNSWRAISQHRCVGSVMSLGETSLILARVADGAEWRIAIGPNTRLPSDLREGDLVEALSQDGITADAVIDYSEPVAP